MANSKSIDSLVAHLSTNREKIIAKIGILAEMYPKSFGVDKQALLEQYRKSQSINGEDYYDIGEETTYYINDSKLIVQLLQYPQQRPIVDQEVEMRMLYQSVNNGELPLHVVGIAEWKGKTRKPKGIRDSCLRVRISTSNIPYYLTPLRITNIG